MSEPPPSADLSPTIATAQHLALKLKEADPLQWLSAMAAGQREGDVVVGTRGSVFGHRITLLDLSDGVFCELPTALPSIKAYINHIQEPQP